MPYQLVCWISYPSTQNVFCAHENQFLCTWESVSLPVDLQLDESWLILTCWFSDFPGMIFDVKIELMKCLSSDTSEHSWCHSLPPWAYFETNSPIPHFAEIPLCIPHSETTIKAEALTQLISTFQKQALVLPGTSQGYSVLCMHHNLFDLSNADIWQHCETKRLDHPVIHYQGQIWFYLDKMIETRVHGMRTK